MITKRIKHTLLSVSWLCCGGAAALTAALTGTFTAAFTVAALTACTDFLTIYPTDRIVAEDFWKKKSDVDQMVDGCYLSMLDYSVQERAIMWGAYRSDELKKLNDYNDNTLDNISAVILLPTNRYAKWNNFYKVINNCNIVLNHAPDVMVEDPEFTEGDYQVVRAQMLALRSLCYFYLVRTFRDVPYTTRSYEDDSQVDMLPQCTPDEVLQHCLDDLDEARQYIMRSGSYGRGDWRNWGYMTRDAVHALMADICLWRAAMTHTTADYRQAIAYSDSVINAKDAYYKLYQERNITDLEEDRYHLEDGDAAYSTIFGYDYGNSHESILEWQYNGRNNSNQALENYYYQSGSESNHAQTGILMASAIFSSVASNANTAEAQKIYLSKNDYRFWNNVYEANNEEAQQLAVRKMVARTGIGNINTLTVGEAKTNGRNFTEFRQNWIVYRLTDVMLMKAEALVETAANDSDRVTLKQAFDLVQAVNKRSMYKNATDTLKFDDFKSKDDMELLVLAERERELCFEGKRWYDLMRYSYRHMEGVNIKQRMADATSWPALYAPMLQFVIRKYSDDGGGDAVSYKMKSEPFLYWPVEESEMKVNNLLNQNPVFIQEKSTSKN